MATAPAIFKERCHYCSRWHLHSDLVRFSDGEIVMCLNCFAWHEAALERFLRRPPESRCAECGVEFSLVSHDGNRRVYMHPKDGEYQGLCRSCSDAYVRKRLDLYADTPYGWARKLKGAH